MRRIERLLNLVIALVDTNRPYTAEEIRDKVAGYGQKTHAAFRRAFERDKDDLRSMGIPLEAVTTDPFKDVPDGYIIRKEEYYLPELDLERDELAALHLAADAVLGVREHAASALLKVTTGAPDLPSGPRALWGADVAAEQPLAAALYAAVVERTPVAFDYEPSGGGRSRRELEPYSLVNRGGSWYVVGRDRDRAALRSFKLSRIRSDVQTLAGDYGIPPSFRVDDHLPAGAWEIGDAAHDAVVRFVVDMRWWAEQNLAHAPSAEGPGGSLDVTIRVANVDALVSWVIELGPGVEVVAPQSFRRRVGDYLAPYATEGEPR